MGGHLIDGYFRVNTAWFGAALGFCIVSVGRLIPCIRALGESSLTSILSLKTKTYCVVYQLALVE